MPELQEGPRSASGRERYAPSTPPEKGSSGTDIFNAATRQGTPPEEEWRKPAFPEGNDFDLNLPLAWRGRTRIDARLKRPERQLMRLLRVERVEKRARKLEHSRKHRSAGTPLEKLNRRA